MVNDKFNFTLHAHKLFRMRGHEDRLFAVSGNENFHLLAYKVHVTARLNLKGRVLYLGHMTGQTAPVPLDRLVETDHICLVTSHRDHQDCLKSCILFPDDTSRERELPSNIKNLM